jgi:transcriptional regulator of acetoin/glycerol metabolism
MKEPTKETAMDSNSTNLPAASDPRKRQRGAAKLEARALKTISKLREQLRMLFELSDRYVCHLPGKTLKQIEIEAVTKSLLRHHGNREETALELGVARSSVFQWIKDWQIEERAGDNSQLIARLVEALDLGDVNDGLSTSTLSGSPGADPTGDGELFLEGKSLRQIRIEALTKSLRRQRGEREATKKELGVARSTVFAWIKEWGIDVPSTYDPSRGKTTIDQAEAIEAPTQVETIPSCPSPENRETEGS